MGFKLFGFEFVRQPKPYENQPSTANAAISFVERTTSDTDAVISASTSFGVYLDLQGVIKSEAELITKYREMLNMPEVVNAVDEIVNESICTDEDFVVKIDLSKLPLDPQSKQMVTDEFEYIQRLYDFETYAYQMYKRWYVDGRLYYHIIIDNKHPEQGIQELRYIDPRKIRGVKEVAKKQVAAGGAEGAGTIEVSSVKNEYYVYNERGLGGTNKNVGVSSGNAGGTLRIAKDTIVHCPSGLTDVWGQMGLSYLQTAMKVLSQLRTIEDHLIIYRLARSAERRLWEIDTGDMNPVKAQAYVQNIATNMKNRLIYDADSGTIRDDRRFPPMTEDFYLPRRADGQGTRVTMLQGGKTLGELDDVLYFQKQLYGSLNVPVARINPDAPFMLGRTQEVSRDEIKFDKFITRLRQSFSQIFTIPLGRQLVLKGLFTIEEWDQLSKLIKYEYARDNHFAELKDAEVMTSRATTFQTMLPLIGSAYSVGYLRRTILKQTEDDIETMTTEISQEMQNPLYSSIYAMSQQMIQQTMGGPGGTEGGPSGEEPEGDTTGGGESGEGDGSSNNANTKKYNKTKKVDHAKHIIQALKDVHGKTPKEMTTLRAAAQVLTKNK